VSFVTVRMGGGAMAATPEPPSIEDERVFLVVVGGSQNYASARLAAKLDRIHAERRIRVLAQTGRRGAEAVARAWAEANGVALATLPNLWPGPPWRRHQRANNRVLLDLRPDLVVAAGGSWPGYDLVCQARERNIPTLVVHT
jgi:YspA, cpYpsA-related SLOG family